MIDEGQYFGGKSHTEEQEQAAAALLDKVNNMLASLAWDYPIDPDTGTSISGSKGGSGDGGFRLPNATTGKTLSKHKTAHAVDVFDPGNNLDNRLDDEILERFGLWREHPDSTLGGWCHLQDVPPKSGKRSFYQ